MLLLLLIAAVWLIAVVTDFADSNCCDCERLY
jgi:hypothetical protein